MTALPTLTVLDRNLTRVETPEAVYFFSYETCVAVQRNGLLYVRENVWGPTTGKHLNRIDGGDKAAKEARLSESDFRWIAPRPYLDALT